MFSICNNSKCSKLKECYRYMIERKPEHVEIEFKNICNKKNKHKWFYVISDDKNIRKEELKETEEAKSS